MKQFLNFIAKFLKKGGLFAILVVGTFYIIFRNVDGKKMLEAFGEANKIYFILGGLAAALFLSCEALNLKRLLAFFGHHVPYGRGLKYAFVGFFFSAVTPSSSGGQPMQLYYMNKDKVDLSHGTLALLLELSSYQIVAVSLGFIGLLIKRQDIANDIGNLKYVFIVGVSFNILLLLILLVGIFSTRISAWIEGLLEKIMVKLKFKNVEKKSQSLRNQLEKYHEGSRYIKRNPMFILRTLGVTSVQLLALNSIPYFVYMALGGPAMGAGSHSFVDIMSLQAILYLTVSALPLPGAVGVSETGFVILFKKLFPASLMGAGMVLSRLINFYGPVAVTGISLMILRLLDKPRKS